MKLLAALPLLFLMTACSPDPANTDTPVKVEIAKTDSGYRLLRAGEPYVIRGAGMVSDDIERFAAHGGNSIRTWSTNSRHQDTAELLDAAQANGVTVALGLSMTAERHGFDYNDPAQVREQLERARDALAGVPSEKYGEEVGAFIVLKEGQTYQPGDIRDFCRGQISHYKIPKYVAFVNDYPMTASGKIQKYKLREMAEELFPNRI